MQLELMRVPTIRNVSWKKLQKCMAFRIAAYWARERTSWPILSLGRSHCARAILTSCRARLQLRKLARISGYVRCHV